jgi:hypothetical protein
MQNCSLRSLRMLYAPYAGDRLKEATKINLSLSALGNVISALVDGKSGKVGLYRPAWQQMSKG